jgi:hypothetical protein
MKEEFNKDVENLRKKNQRETQGIKVHNSNKKYGGKKLQQTRTSRISGLEDKIDIKEKTEELLDKRLKSCKRNT